VHDVFQGDDALEAGGRGVVEDRCSFRMEEVCRYKYLINVSPGGSYTVRSYLHHQVARRVGKYPQCTGTPFFFHIYAIAR